MEVTVTFDIPQDDLQKVVQESMKKMPDFRFVVFCKDCKWFGTPGCAIKIVDDTDKPTEDDYCSFGERKEGEQ